MSQYPSHRSCQVSKFLLQSFVAGLKIDLFRVHAFFIKSLSLLDLSAVRGRIYRALGVSRPSVTACTPRCTHSESLHFPFFSRFRVIDFRSREPFLLSLHPFLGFLHKLSTFPSQPCCESQTALARLRRKSAGRKCQKVLHVFFQVGLAPSLAKSKLLSRLAQNP